MEPNHMHNVLAFFAFFILCALGTHAIILIDRSKKRTAKLYRIKPSNCKAGDCITPTDSNYTDIHSLAAIVHKNASK